MTFAEFGTSFLPFAMFAAGLATLAVLIFLGFKWFHRGDNRYLYAREAIRRTHPGLTPEAEHAMAMELLEGREPKHH